MSSNVVEPWDNNAVPESTEAVQLPTVQSPATCDTSVSDRVLTLVYDYEKLVRELDELDKQQEDVAKKIIAPISGEVKALQDQIDALMEPYNKDLRRVYEEYGNTRKFMIGAQDDIKRNLSALASAIAQSVHGTSYMAVYTPAGFDYDKQMLDGLATAIPAIKSCGKPTLPRLSLRKKTGKSIIES